MSNGKWIILGSGNGSTNLGDESMWEAAAAHVRTKYPDDEIVTDAPPSWKPPLSNVRTLPNLALDLRRGAKVFGRPKNRLLRFMESALSVPFRNRYAKNVTESRELEQLPLGRAWAQEISTARGLIYSGAGAINDDYAVHGVFAWLMLARYATSHSVPVAMVGQGVGPFRSSEVQSAATELIGLANVLSVRDEKSYALVNEARGQGYTWSTPDWALAHAPDAQDRANAANVIQRYIGGSKFVVASLHRRGRRAGRQLSLIARDLDRILNDARDRDYRVLFVGNMYSGWYSDDRKTAELLLKRLSDENSEELIVPSEVFTAGTVRALIGASHGLFATRYHPMVFALAEGVPAVGLTYDEYYVQKLSGVSADFGLTENLFPIGTLDGRSTNVVTDVCSMTVRSLDAAELARIRKPLDLFLRTVEA